MEVVVSGYVFYLCEAPNILMKNRELYTDPKTFAHIAHYINYNEIEFESVGNIRMLYVDAKRYGIVNLVNDIETYIREYRTDMLGIIDPNTAIRIKSETIVKLIEEGELDAEIPENPNLVLLQALENKADEARILCMISMILLYLIVMLYNYLGLVYDRTTLQIKIDLLCKKTNLIRIIRLVGVQNLDMLLSFISMVAVDAH